MIPKLDEIELKSVLEKNFSFKVKQLEFVPKGADADSYIITTYSDEKFFCKVYDLKKINKLNLKINFNSLKVLNSLYKNKVSFIARPILTKNKELSVNLDENYKIVLAQFIQGKNDDKQLTKTQLEKLSKLLADIHKSPFSIKKLVSYKETFDTKILTQLKNVLKTFLEQDFPKRSTKTKISKVIRESQSEILRLVKNTFELAKELTADEKEFVVTHSDPYFLNLIKTENDVYLIDWDGMKLAPKEQDIWFYLIKDICNKPFVFLNGYQKHFGKVKLDKKMVHYYIKSRVLTDLHNYLKNALSGKNEEIQLNEIQDYAIKWTLNMENILSDVDKIIDRFNK